MLPSRSLFRGAIELSASGDRGSNGRWDGPGSSTSSFRLGARPKPADDFEDDVKARRRTPDDEAPLMPNIAAGLVVWQSMCSGLL